MDRDAWVARSLADEDIVRFGRSLGPVAFAASLLDGMVIRTRLDRKATNISVLAAIGVRRDGQKILLSIKHMGWEIASAWRQFLDDLDARGLSVALRIVEERTLRVVGRDLAMPLQRRQQRVVGQFEIS